MNGQYFANLLLKLHDSVKAKRRRKLRRGVLIQQDNAPVHTSQNTMLSARDYGFEFLLQTPCSPDSRLPDFH